jgi:predicted secreted protein
MKTLSFVVIAALMLSLVTAPVFAQSGYDGSAWRDLAQHLDAGVAMDVRLRDGHHFKATFIAAHDQTMLVQRKTRVPVATEEIPYDSIASLARVQPGSISGGKIAGIALGSAGAVIGVLFLIALAVGD